MHFGGAADGTLPLSEIQKHAPRRAEPGELDDRSEPVGLFGSRGLRHHAESSINSPLSKLKVRNSSGECCRLPLIANRYSREFIFQKDFPVRPGPDRKPSGPNYKQAEIFMTEPSIEIEYLDDGAIRLRKGAWSDKVPRSQIERWADHYELMHRNNSNAGYLEMARALREARAKFLL